MKSELFQIMSWWIDKLDALSEAQLRVHPSRGGWTPGQLYVHLITDTRFYMEQIAICISNDDHADEKMSAEGYACFATMPFLTSASKGIVLMPLCGSPTTKMN